MDYSRDLSNNKLKYIVIAVVTAMVVLAAFVMIQKVHGNENPACHTGASQQDMEKFGATDTAIGNSCTVAT